jgi:hypothetical protein
MRPGISLMYLEGEVKGGRLTGRTILVIETEQKVDLGVSGSHPASLRQLIAAACIEWEKHCQPADLVRVEHCPADGKEARGTPYGTAVWRLG